MLAVLATNPLLLGPAPIATPETEPPATYETPYLTNYLDPTLTDAGCPAGNAPPGNYLGPPDPKVTVCGCVLTYVAPYNSSTLIVFDFFLDPVCPLAGAVCCT
jgi:hypothetical protein